MDVLNVPHLHLLLNHIPTVGGVLGLGLLLLSLVRKSHPLTIASLEVLVVIALLTIPAYITGTAAQGSIEDLPGVSRPSIERHESAALLAFAFMQITGAAAWLALWHARRTSRPGNLKVVVLLAVATVALMTRAATIGGEISHPEIRGELDTTATAEPGPAAPVWLTSASIAELAKTVPSIWPAAEALHFIGMALMFGVVLLANLRLLGMMKQVPFSAMHRLLPWAAMGLGLNVVTGMFFFIAAFDQYVGNVVFLWKMILMVPAGTSVLYLTVRDTAWALAPGDEPALTDKVVAVTTMGLWAGIMYLGRMLPFLGDAF